NRDNLSLVVRPMQNLLPTVARVRRYAFQEQLQ
ncbi:hypothetical protein AVDCRST_MAG94-6530, partial [uncultured Leptolyngbya sp.]